MRTLRRCLAAAMLALPSALIPAAVAAQALPSKAELDTLARAYGYLEEGAYETAQLAYEEFRGEAEYDDATVRAARYGVLLSLLEETFEAGPRRSSQRLPLARFAIETERRRGHLRSAHLEHALYLVARELGEMEEAEAHLKAARDLDREFARLDFGDPRTPGPTARRTPAEPQRTRPAAEPEPAPAPAAEAEPEAEPAGEEVDVVRLAEPLTLYASQDVNLRSAPRTGRDTWLAQIGRGTKLRVIGRVKKRRWLQAAHNGRTVFVHGDYLAETPPGSAPAPAAEPEPEPEPTREARRDPGTATDVAPEPAIPAPRQPTAAERCVAEGYTRRLPGSSRFLLHALDSFGECQGAGSAPPGSHYNVVNGSAATCGLGTRMMRIQLCNGTVGLVPQNLANNGRLPGGNLFGAGSGGGAGDGAGGPGGAD
ncbi:MAG: SH3 domain-containing protein [Pseudomonadota bacterium]